MEFKLILDINERFKKEPFYHFHKDYKQNHSTEIIPDSLYPDSMYQKFKRSSDIRNLSSIPLNSFNYYKPTFFNLVEHNFFTVFKKEKVEKGKNMNLFIDDNNFMTILDIYLPILRGILDSKWNEFMYFDHYKMYSKFTDFVYSWWDKIFNIFLLNIYYYNFIKLNIFYKNKI